MEVIEIFKEATGKQQITYVPVLNIDGNVVTDLYKIANAFNIYFTNVSIQVTKHLLNTVLKYLAHLGDNVSASLINSAGVHVVPSLVHIINCSIDTASFPSVGKVAKIVSIH